MPVSSIGIAIAVLLTVVVSMWINLCTDFDYSHRVLIPYAVGMGLLALTAIIALISKK